MMNQDVDIDWDKVALMDTPVLLEFANELHESLNIEQAKQAFQILLHRDPQNIEVVDNYTDCLESLGLVQEMEKVLKQYVNQQQLILQYEHNHKLYFKYAQLQEGKQSIQVYEFGINLLAPKVQTNALYAKEIADAYAAIAEVYQTDLLQFPESEQACTYNINMAFKYDPMNLDAFLQLASYHLNKEDEEAAKKDLKIIVEKLQTDQENYDQDFQLQVSKLLVEVEEYNQSIIVLRKLIDQDHSNAESLYMLAFSLWKSKKFDEALKLVQGILAMPDIMDDEEIYTGTIELKQELEKEDYSQTQQEEEWMDIE